MSKANILVVEDQDSIRHFVVKALEDEGHLVRGVDSVREARKELEKDMPDLAFFDLKLPDGSGLDLLKEVKRLPMKRPVGKYNVWNKTRLSAGTSH